MEEAGIIFNADEAFALAEQIERNGQEFYRSASEMASGCGGNVAGLLSDLADWEATHEQRFAAMRDQLSEEDRKPTAFDPQGESEMYLQAMADGHVFKVGTDPSTVLSTCGNAEEIIQAALSFETDTILFFLGLEDLIPQRLGKDKIAEIIGEEKRHVAFLKRQLQELQDDQEQS